MKGLPHGSIMWEIPKGRKNKRENSLDCAIREFKEETSMTTDDYNMLFDIPPIVETHVSMNKTYINTFHLAFSANPPDLSVSLETFQASEVGDIRWMSLKDVQVIDDRLTESVTQIFDKFQSKYTLEQL
jgi:8-oxo-dGTP pyrophosphatase MutT (NUDIX family)